MRKKLIMDLPNNVTYCNNLPVKSEPPSSQVENGLNPVEGNMDIDGMSCVIGLKDMTIPQQVADDGNTAEAEEYQSQSVQDYGKAPSRRGANPGGGMSEKGRIGAKPDQETQKTVTQDARPDNCKESDLSGENDLMPLAARQLETIAPSATEDKPLLPRNNDQAERQSGATASSATEDKPLLLGNNSQAKRLSGATAPSATEDVPLLVGNNSQAEVAISVDQENSNEVAIQLAFILLKAFEAFNSLRSCYNSIMAWRIMAIILLVIGVLLGFNVGCSKNLPKSSEPSTNLTEWMLNVSSCTSWADWAAFSYIHDAFGNLQELPVTCECLDSNHLVRAYYNSSHSESGLPQYLAITSDPNRFRLRAYDAGGDNYNIAPVKYDNWNATCQSAVSLRMKNNWIADVLHLCIGKYFVESNKKISIFEKLPDGKVQMLG